MKSFPGPNEIQKLCLQALECKELYREAVAKIDLVKVSAVIQRYAIASGHKYYPSPDSKIEIGDLDEHNLYVNWDGYSDDATFELPIELLDEEELVKLEQDAEQKRFDFVKQQKEQIDALKRKQLESLKAYFGEA